MNISLNPGRKAPRKKIQKTIVDDDIGFFDDPSNLLNGGVGWGVDSLEIRSGGSSSGSMMKNKIYSDNLEYISNLFGSPVIRGIIVKINACDGGNTDYKQKTGNNFLDEKTLILGDEENNTLLVFKEEGVVVTNRISSTVHILDRYEFNSDCIIRRMEVPAQVPNHLRDHLRFVENNHSYMMNEPNISKIVNNNSDDSGVVKDQIRSVVDGSDIIGSSPADRPVDFREWCTARSATNGGSSVVDSIGSNRTSPLFEVSKGKKKEDFFSYALKPLSGLSDNPLRGLASSAQSQCEISPPDGFDAWRKTNLEEASMREASFFRTHYNEGGICSWKEMKKNPEWKDEYGNNLKVKNVHICRSCKKK